MIILFGLQFTAAQLIITLGLIVAILLALVILARLPKKHTDEQQAVSRQNELALAPASLAEEVAQEELVAVLAAAIAAATGMQADSFRISSYQQIGPSRGRSVWSKAGRREQMSRMF